MRVFLDANTYIDYLRGRNASKKDLLDFEKALEKKDFKLICPQTTKDEVLRGYPQKSWEDTRAQFNNQGLPAGIEDWPIYEEAMSKLGDLNKALVKVSENLDIFLKALYTDHIEKIMNYAIEDPIDEKIIKKAKLRKFLGNPPGKKSDPHGDEIAWEIILDRYVDDDVTIITSDPDWGNETLKPFLEKEWKSKTAKTISLHTSIRSFLEPKPSKEKKVKDSKELTPPEGGVTFSIPVVTTFVGAGSLPSINHPAFFGSYFAPGVDSTIECYNCHFRFQIPGNFTMGAISYSIPCPNCGSANPV